MAPPAGTLRVWRYFAALLGVLVVLYAIVFWPGQRSTPKLGLDLEGGTQVVLQANLPGGKTPSSSDMRQARTILTNRVDAQGVNNAEVVQEGNNRIVISVPGKEGKNLKDVSQAALLQFRPEIQAAVAASPASSASTSSSASPKASGASGSGSANPGITGTAAPTTTAPTTTAPTTTAPTTTAAGTTAAPTASASQSGQGEGVPLAAASAAPTPTASASASPTASAKPTASSSSAKASATPSASPSTSTAPAGAPINQWAKLGFAPPTTATGLAALTTAQQTAVQNVVTAWSCDDTPLDQPTVPLITCDQGKAGKYLLGPVIVPGREVDSASAQAPDATNGSFGWSVNLSLKSSGQAAWATYTSEHNEAKAAGDIANQVAFTLDSSVLTVSTIQSTINGNTQISNVGGEKDAESLANSLKFGALPINFTEPDFTNVSATLGSSQLRAGLLAGGIGLFLVVVYSLLYYRALGLVTIASLIVSGLLTYAMLVILGVQINLTLTLAGIAGFIVAVGITADSFVVFFERIKDEVHEGRSAKVAVPRAWLRARRTIISADTVSLLAALILYYFAAGDVRGFAFTLGLSTVLDLVVVFLFTHPLVSLASRVEKFGSARLTGLNSLRAARPDLAFAGPAPAYEARPSAAEPVDPSAAVGSEIPSNKPTAPNKSTATSKPASARRPTSKPTSPAKSGTPVDVSKPAGPATAQPSANPPKVAKPVGATAAERAAARRGLATKPAPAKSSDAERPLEQPAGDDGGSTEGERSS